MINICFFAGDITRSGGTERVATVIANALSHTGKYTISFLSLVEQKEAPFYEISPKVRRSVLKKNRKWVSPGIGYLPFIPELRKYLKKQRIDIVIDVDLVLDILSLPAVAGLSVKVISWEHFNYFFERNIGYRRAVLGLSVIFSDYIVTLTERDRQNYRMLAHCKKKVVTIENPLIIQNNTDVSKEKILITVGQLIYRKGIDMLVKIIPDILKKYPEWKWYFLGDGEYMGVLEEIRRRYGLEERLILKGTVADVERYLMRASIMVMGSREEGFGMCFLEARACRVPCIAFDIPVGPLELIAHGINGFLISPFDLVDMKEKICQLIEDDLLRERFMCNAVMGMEKYQLKTVLRKWSMLLDTIHADRICDREGMRR